MRSYFVSIPNELLEAALIDGASTWQAFWKIIFPVARPGVITTIVIALTIATVYDISTDVSGCSAAQTGYEYNQCVEDSLEAQMIESNGMADLYTY